MNKVYRLVWNRALGVLQVATELASSPRGGVSPGRGVARGAARSPLARACLVALALSLGVAALPASAASPTFVVTSATDSGDTGVPGSLSWAIAQANAQPGSVISLHLASGGSITETGTLPSLDCEVTFTSPSDVTLNANFHGEGTLNWAGDGTLTLTGTQQDVAWNLVSGTLQLGHGDGAAAFVYGANRVDADGGAGVTAGDGTTLNVDAGSVVSGGYGWMGAYGGGAGVVAGAATIDNAGVIAGSQGSPGFDVDGIEGGEGGEGEVAGEAGQDGGTGGAGVQGESFTLDNAGTVNGGMGGYGGSGGTIIGNYGGAGGAGGAAVAGAGFTVSNSGFLQGGIGGYGGLSGYGGAGGIGGAGVSGEAFSLANTGSIHGGTGGIASTGSWLDGTAGTGGAGVSGNQFQLDNRGTIGGGFGGQGAAGYFGGSGDGGAGGAGVSGNGFSASNRGTVTGGNGGAGGNGGKYSSEEGIPEGGLSLATAAGMGGAAGAGVSGAGFSFDNHGTIAGGNGGNGGKGGAGYGPYAGDMDMNYRPANPAGGAGAAGVSGTGFTFTNAGSIAGGHGGNGGTVTAYGKYGDGGNGGYGPTTAPVLTAAAGGAGGAGVSGAGFTLTNTGSITGGDGGAGGYASTVTAPPVLLLAASETASETDGEEVIVGPAGTGGAGVVATGGATLINAGTIAGGLANDGYGARANAVDFSGGHNTLVVQAGSKLIGNAVSHSGAGQDGDTLALGGDTDGSFALGQIGAVGGDARYQGFARFLKSGSGTWTLTGTAAGAQGWTVAAGELAVDGQLAVQLVVEQATRLSGNGTLGSLDLAGTLAPGHSIGTLTTTGDAVIRDTAVYEVETDEAGHSDQLVVGGKLVLQGGTVLSLAKDGHYNLDSPYTIIKAKGGIEGRFAAFESSLAFLTPTVDYLGSTVTMTLLRNNVDFCAVASTANQCAVGGALTALGSGAVHDALLTQDADTARAAMAEWSGESFASTRTVLLDDSRFVRQAMGDRLHRADGSRDNARAIGESAGAVWATGWQHAGHVPGDGNASRVRSDGHGLLLGVDAPLGDQWRVGVSAGLGQDVARVDALGSETSVHSKHLGAYAGAAWGGWTAEGGLASSWHDIASTRQLTAVLPARLHADYHGRSTGSGSSPAMRR